MFALGKDDSLMVELEKRYSTWPITLDSRKPYLRQYLRNGITLNFPGFIVPFL
jgi:hypothetical protein